MPEWGLRVAKLESPGLAVAWCSFPVKSMMDCSLEIGKVVLLAMFEAHLAALCEH